VRDGDRDPQHRTGGTGGTAHPGVLALVNARAGSASRELERALSALASGASELGGVLEVARTSSLADLRGVLGRLAGRRLVVLGGDGSLHAAVQALHDAGALRAAGPVGVVPMGTGNDLARTLGLAIGDPPAAVRTALTGTPVDLELLVEDGGGIAVNAVHAGIGVAATQRAERLKPVLRRVAYPVGVLAAGVARPWGVRVVVDGREVHDGRRPLLMVAASIGTTIGGGAPVSPTSVPHDGVVDVVVSTATGPVARAGYARTLMRGQHVERRDVAVTRGADVLLEAVDGRPFALNADGETGAPALRHRWRTLPDAWSVRVP